MKIKDKKIFKVKRDTLHTIVHPQAKTTTKKKNNLKPYLISYTKANSKFFLDINIKHKALKLPEENLGENICDLRWGKGFIDTVPKT